MKKECFGFAVFDKESGKAITISFGVSNRLSLTDDPLRVYLAPTAEQAEVYPIWFNNSHKNKKEFEIKYVVRTITLDEA
jgi:hypothetical protein